MSARWLRLRGRDPLLFRDGRPFGNELGALTARTLALPAPGTLAGFVRTRAGEAAGWSWNEESAARARQLAIAGPLLEQWGNPVLPAPADALIWEAEENEARGEPPGLRLMPLRPASLPAGAGCDLPAGLRPLRPEAERKPAEGCRYWPADRLLEWLADETGRNTSAPPRIDGPPIEERAHVAVQAATRAAAEGQLFTTQGLAFGEEWSLLARVPADLPPLAGLAPFGGEGRLATVEELERFDPLPCPPALTETLRQAAWVRMLLVTPGCFAGGWKPGWLDERLAGSPPGAPEVSLRLAAAAVPRREAVSGWDYAKRRPKPTRWLAPAGSVYFFEVTGGTPAALAGEAWLAPVSDADQDRRDGYGLALWGGWKGEGASQ